jgi:hypothetical protein
MHYNRRTSALLAAGVISFAAIAHAEEKATPVLTALSSTTLSGYVDTSAQWNFGTGNANNPPYAFGGPGKADGFNLNVVKLTLERPPEGGDAWNAGYKVDLIFGPDANALATQNGGATTAFPGRDFGVKQAYVALHAPVGNGLDFKIGVWDTVIGYEVFESGSNPNFTRSYGYTIEPTTHTGVHVDYQFSDAFSVSFCLADTLGPTINGRAFPVTGGSPLGGNKAESFKTYMGMLNFTAPKDWGFLAGSTLSAGVINGFSASYGENQTSWYLGGTFATPVNNLKVGAAFDYLDVHNWHSPRNFPNAANDGNAWAAGLYALYQATEKLSLNLRGEYLDDQAFYFPNQGDEGEAFKVWALTATAQYDLWKNVISRVEFRWDHSDSGSVFGFNPNTSSPNPNRRNAFMLAANIIYKF